MLSGARTTFCASHTDKNGRMHGHSYEVWAYWDYQSVDVDERQAQLVEHVSINFDHRVLHEWCKRAEQIAESIGTELGAKRVVVRRPLEGLEGIWPG